MNSIPVPPIVYTHPIKTPLPIVDSVRTYSIERPTSLEAASIVHLEKPGANVSPASFTPSTQPPGAHWGPDMVPPQKSDTYIKRKYSGKKDMNDYLFEFYVGSITIVGLLILFRFIQKS